MFNGIAAIVAIQTAGLAVAQALWSGLSVFVAFVWGAAVFREPVASLPLALAGAIWCTLPGVARQLECDITETERPRLDST